MNHTNGRVIRFERDGAQVRQMARRQREQGQPLTALELLRPSLDRAYEPETVLMIAEIYAEMNCWALSNQAFFSLAHTQEYAAQCFFGIGYNLYKMQDYTAARDCFLMVQQDAPDSVFAPDAEELLDIIEEASEPLDAGDLRMRKRMERVLDAMDRGRAGLANRQIRRVLALRGHSGGIRSLQAFALLADGDAEGALAAARLSLRASPHDIRALCAMASALKANHAMDVAQAYLKRAIERISQEDDMRLAVQTACEMGEHAVVKALLRVNERHAPYDTEALWTLSVALHNTGETEEAARYWRLIRRIDPYDTIAGYWLGMLESVPVAGEMPYAHQVPLSEILYRIRMISGWVHEGREALCARWREEELLRALLRWGLTCGEADIPRVACNILSTIDDPAAQQALRDVLSDVNASTDLKRSALAALYTMGQEGPFYALIDDRLTRVHVSRVAEDQAAENEACAKAIQTRAAHWLTPETQEGQARLEALCGIAAALHGEGLGEGVMARAAVLAYCEEAGIPAPFSSTFQAHRRIERLARRILKEAEHADHQL